jgi:hypothetical protein
MPTEQIAMALITADMELERRHPLMTLFWIRVRCRRRRLLGPIQTKLNPEWTKKRDAATATKRIIEANGSSVLRWSFLVLFVGIITSVVGYVGCFCAVQGSGSSREALIWLCLEMELSIIRITLWGINPKGDDAPPLEFAFQLDKHATYSRSAEETEKAKILSLVRATEFLEAITSCTGLLNQFSDPRLTLYYVARDKEDVDNMDWNTHGFWSAKDPINLRHSECKWLSLQHSQLPCHPSCTEQERIRPLHPSPLCVS